MKKRISPRLWLSLLLVLLAGACSSTKGPQPQPKTNVLIITLDTTRADRLGCYGSDRGLTPFLDSFAKDAVLFTNCEAAVPLTLPSHTTIFSGLYPVHAGVRVNMSARVPEEVPLLSEEFQKSGYSTAAFVSATVLLKRYGLNRGFDVYDQSFFDPRNGMFQRAHAKQTLAKAGSWLAGQEGNFFLWIHLYDPHFRYILPPEYQKRFAEDPYDGTIAYMDSELGKFFASDAMKGWKNWYVIICADHGESLGQHRESRHGMMLYQATTHVPLMIHLPGRFGGKRVNDLVSLVDVAPTIRTMLNLPEPASQDGNSLQPAMEGGTFNPRPCFIESISGMTTYGWAPLFAVVEDHWKYIQAPRPELYDLKADPAETDNLYDSRPEIQSSLAQDVKDYEARRPVGSSGAESLSEEEQNQLAGLGYLQGGFSSNSASKRDPKDYVDLEDDFLEISFAFRDKRYAKIQRLLDKIEKRDPDDPYLYFNRGKLAEITSWKKAAEYYAGAVKLAPTYNLAWSMWIRLLLNHGRNGEAAKLARTALSSCPDSMGYFNVALAEEAFLKGRPASEIRSRIEKAIEMNPHMARAFMVGFELDLRERFKDRAEDDTMKVWKNATREEVNSWAGDPLFRNFFEAQPRNAGNEAPRFEKKD